MRLAARLRHLAIMGLASMVLAGAGAGDEWAEELARLPASTVDPMLPDQKFALWLNDNVVRHLPKDAARETYFVPCETDPDNCRMLAFDIVSRARRLVLTFDRETYAFRGGTLGGLELEPMPPIASLAELPGRLTEAARPYPLACPEGTALRLEEEYAGLREWCEDAVGVKQGAARAWFSTGRYLMYRGGYLDGKRHGPWFECSRFERCVRKRYLEGTVVPLERGG